MKKVKPTLIRLSVAQMLAYFQLFSPVEETKELGENQMMIMHSQSVENSPHILPGRVSNPGHRDIEALLLSEPCWRIKNYIIILIRFEQTKSDI